jgi:hypothetical protein
MTRKINFKNTTAPQKEKKQQSDSSRIYTASLEYGLLANLVQQQYQAGPDVLWEKLLALPLEDRLPGLMERYGKKQLHQLLLTLFKEFVASLKLPAYKCPNATQLSVCACELMLSANEDWLAIEDIILFFRRVEQTHYGPVKTLATMTMLVQSLEQYREERHAAYTCLRDARNAAYKEFDQAERMAPEPTLFSSLVQQAMVIGMNKKMSG